MDILYPLRRLHGWTHDKKIIQQKKRALYDRFITPFLACRRSGKPCVFLVMTPEHGNIGDQAIVHAEIKMLRRLGISFVEISEYQLRQFQSLNCLDMLDGYPIVMQGGGYLGTIWFEVEVLLREFLKAVPKSTVLMFPNTVYYEASEWGQTEWEASVELYNRHQRLFLNAREAVSYNVMKNAYRHVKLIPDIVLSLDVYEGSTKERNGCLLCLRDDHEKTRTQEKDEEMLVWVKEQFGERYAYTDMCVEYRVSPQTREQEIAKKMDEFCGAELVITDRLHAMIFCAVTQTPCIVINSQSPKVRGCYEWIKQCAFIQFAEDIAGFDKVYKLVSSAPKHYSNQHLQPYYDELMNDIELYFKKRK